MSNQELKTILEKRRREKVAQDNLDERWQLYITSYENLGITANLHLFLATLAK